MTCKETFFHDRILSPTTGPTNRVRAQSGSGGLKGRAVRDHRDASGDERTREETALEIGIAPIGSMRERGRPILSEIALEGVDSWFGSTYRRKNIAMKRADSAPGSMKTVNARNARIENAMFMEAGPDSAFRIGSGRKSVKRIASKNPRS